MDTPDIPEFPQFIYETTTRWSDDDSQGVLNNAVYLTLFEEARHAFCRAIEVIGEDGAFPFLLAQCNVRFVSPGRGGRTVRIELSTTHLGTKSFRQAYRVRNEDGDIWAEGESVLVCYDAETLASREIPEDLRDALASLMG